MAEEQGGPRPAAWTKIFSGFKVALDLKKLALAGAGIFCMWVGWWVLSVVAYNLVSKPDWDRDYPQVKAENKEAEWTRFKARRASWNLLHELAGDSDAPYEVADVATTLQEYETLRALKSDYSAYQDDRVKITATGAEGNLEVAGKKYTFKYDADPKELLKDAKDREFPLRDLTFKEDNQFELAKGTDVIVIKLTANADDLRKTRAKAADLAELEKRAADLKGEEAAAYKAALTTFKAKLLPRGKDAVLKPGGRLRTSPWHEDRGENPYLLVTRMIKESSVARGTQAATVPRGHFLAAFGEMVPVLLEPLIKILTPIIYLFNHNADWYVQIYLLLVLLLALAVWAFFGGAITRLAAVQIARNEKISLREAVKFACDRFVSFFSAPGFPLLLLAILVVCLWLFGWVEGFIPLVGDIIIAGLLWPIVLIVGLIMAVVLVGLVGWPLMNATISVEGSDSFDALSRSYSYVYQAPWQYLWYGFLATVYGAALVFFVGFMASLLVFLGKWGIGMTPGIGSADPKNDREPSYFFCYAPTSFGWRDLLIHNSAHVVPVERPVPGGPPAIGYEFKKAYIDEMTWYNKVGATLITFWIGAFFLLVVGFGYSYFWTASTIIYFLMRRHVDDTDMDEVHLEEDEATDPFAQPPVAPPSAASAGPGKVSLSMVDAPTLRTGMTPGAPPSAPPTPAPPPTAPPPTAPLAPPESPAPPPAAGATEPPPDHPPGTPPMTP